MYLQFTSSSQEEPNPGNYWISSEMWAALSGIQKYLKDQNKCMLKLICNYHVEKESEAE